MKKIFVPCHSSNYRVGRTQDIKYIVIHYTANNGDTAKNNVEYYANSKVEASAHYFVDEYDTVYQSVKEKDTAWAVGGTKKYIHPECRNANSISIEMCSRNKNGSGKPATDDGWYFKPETISNAVALTKELMQKYNIPVSHVIRHYDVWGKICPAPFVNNPEQWDDFKKRLTESEGLTMTQYEELKKLITKIKEPVYHYLKDVPEWGQPTIKKIWDKGYFKGENANDLNLPYSMLRALVILDRAGAFDK
jgi:N-acetylmuramoyl-L-alanine amidase